MATSKSFFGLRKGSTKSLTFTRRNGKQVTKDRVYEVANPSTDAQLFQRAIWATVMKAYAAGKEIFDHSFEGVPFGASNQVKFMKVNEQRLRAQVKADYDAVGQPGHEPSCCVVARGSHYPVPNAYQVSQGSLAQTQFTVLGDETDENVVYCYLPLYSTESTIAEYCQSVGIKEGDIFTIVVFAVTGQMDSNAQSPCKFGFLRLKTKTGITTSTDPIGSLLLGTLFELEGQFDNDLLHSEPWSNIYVDSIITDAIGGCMAVIKSREDSKQRSTSYMVMPSKINFGIPGENALLPWKDTAVQLGQSPWILEGGDLNPHAAPVPTPTPTATPIANSLRAVKIGSDAAMVCKMSDDTYRVLAYNGQAIKGSQFEDPGMASFGFIPNIAPYGQTQEQPENVPIHFESYFQDSDTLPYPLINSALVFTAYDWDAEDNYANWSAGIMVNEIMVSYPTLIIASDSSPITLEYIS